MFAEYYLVTTRFLLKYSEQAPQSLTGWAKIQSILIDTIREIISYRIISIDLF